MRPVQQSAAATARTFLLTIALYIPITCSAQLSGSYTIDPAGGPFPNFTGIQAAIDSLSSQGIDSAVVFNIADGNYYGHYYFPQVAGANAVKTITFQGNETDSTKVRLYYNQTSEGGGLIFMLDNAAHYVFRKMTIEPRGNDFARVLTTSYTWNIGYTIENCLLKGESVGGRNRADQALIWHRANEGTSNRICYRNNYFANGTYGIFLAAFGGEYNNVEITGNIFRDQRDIAIQVNNGHGMRIHNNDIYQTGSEREAIYLQGCYDDISVLGNRIVKTAGTYPAIYMAVCYGKGAIDKGIIANNFISIGGTSTAHGISLNQCRYQGFYHNSVSVGISNPEASALFETGGQHLELKNNIFSNTGGGYAYYTDNTSSITASDHNNYYTTGEYLANWGSSALATLDGLRSANGDDAHSVSVNPRFNTETDLHTNTFWLDGLGVTITGISTDIDGETRSDPPDIGADEFEPVLPLAGNYWIGGDSDDYITIKEAFDDLQAKGVSGPTTFMIRSGEYNEFIGAVDEIPGAGPRDSIVFRSESGNPEDVILHYLTDINNRVILFLRNVDHFTLRDISISATGMDYGLALYLRGDCENVNIINNHLASENTADALLQITEGSQDNVHVHNNSFSKGSYGLYFTGIQSKHSTNIAISGNSFSGSRVNAIHAGYHYSPRIADNEIHNVEHTGMLPLEILNCTGNPIVSGNIINNQPGDLGIKMENCISTSPFEGYLVNNMIQVGENSTAYGIWVLDSKRQNIYHNSINITSTDTVGGRGIYIQDNNEEIAIVNNIVSNSGKGYALYVNDSSDISLSDHNGLWTEGTNLASWGGKDYGDLAALNRASGMDENSLTISPEFYSQSDLHTKQRGFMQAGMPLEPVRFDIDGHPRDTLNPDIGAMEFYCETPDWDIDVSVTCVGDTTTFINNSSKITEGADFSWDFNGDSSPEIYSEVPNEKVTHDYDSAGSYNLIFIVNQLEGCRDYVIVPVNVIARPVLQYTTDGAYCGNSDGTATVRVSGGQGGYRYAWSTGSTDSTARNLELGTYTVAVSDSFGCTSTMDVTVPEAFRVEVTPVQGSTCGRHDGIAEVMVTGGVEPYTFVWSDGDTLARNEGMAPGRHFVQVYDANNCNAGGSVYIGNEGSGPQINWIETVHNQCFGEKAGSIDIEIKCDNPPCDILWSNGEQTEDIQELPSGIYDVMVLDKDSCPATASFIIQAPSDINIGSVVEDASCKGSDGRIGLLVSGGMEPYTYSWSNGGNRAIADSLPAGIYTVLVTDSAGCKKEESIIVNSVGGPVMHLISLTHVTCGDPQSGSINVGTTGGTLLYDHLWSPGGQTKPSIENIPVGVYEVRVTDANGCEGFARFELEEATPASNPICLVTVDHEIGMNMIVWEKSVRAGISHYNVYRQSHLADDYQLIGSVSADEESLYIDSVADPTLKSWRYRLSTVDQCGNESELSNSHKTIHLTMNVGLQESVNLIWDHYEGFDVSTYRIWRYDPVLTWTAIDSLYAERPSFTDKDLPELEPTYYIEAEHPYGCTTDDHKANSFNSSKSNRKTKLKSGQTAVGQAGIPTGLIIYPNPGTGIFNLLVDLPDFKDIWIEVYDVSGKKILAQKHACIYPGLNPQIDLSACPSGLYRVRVRTSNSVYNRLVVKD